MFINIKGIRIHISFLFAAVAAYAVNTGTGEKLAVVFVSALLHELTHTAFLLCYGVKELVLTISPAGASIRGDKITGLSHRQNAVAALSAPMVNLLIAAITAVLGTALKSKELYTVCAVNACLGIVNLLPLSFFDGGRALFSLMSAKYECEKAMHICKICELIAFVFLSVACVMLAVFTGRIFSASVFFVYCSVMILKNNNYLFITKKRGGSA